MNINELIHERKEDWEKLEHIATKLGSAATRSQLTREELWELGRLYTAAVSDLSTLKSSGIAEHLDHDVLAYLNNLVMRVHGGIYHKPPFRWSSFRRFFARDFPGTVRDAGRYVLCSVTVLASFALLGFGLALKEPGFIELLVPESMIARVEEGKVWFEHLHTVAPMASSWLMTHNVSVTFLTIAVGITFGIGTVYLLAINGLLLGTVAALCFSHGLSLQLWSFVLPHGSLELSAICIAGASGLILGHSLIDPGPYRRGELLAFRSRSVGALALGCVPLLVLAGLIEAFFSPASLPYWMKFLFAGFSFSSLLIYLCVAGRTGDRDAVSIAPNVAGRELVSYVRKRDPSQK